MYSLGNGRKASENEVILHTANSAYGAEDVFLN